MNKNWIKKINAIAKQVKGGTNGITSQEWNFIINSLAEQANNNTTGVSESFYLIEKLEDFIQDLMNGRVSFNTIVLNGRNLEDRIILIETDAENFKEEIRNYIDSENLLQDQEIILKASIEYVDGQFLITNQNILTLSGYVDQIVDGTVVVKKAEQDKNGNDIVNTYETKSVVSSVNNRVTSLENANMVKSVSYEPMTHIITFTFYDNTTQSLDLPLESAIIGASYDNVTKDITFTLQNGSTLVVPLDDLISGLASETWVTTYFIPKTALKTAFSGTPLDTNVISEKLAKDSLDLKEDLANKAIDFSVLNDTKYPTTKAVSERLLNLPIAELNNHTLREVFEGGNLAVVNVTNQTRNGIVITNNGDNTYTLTGTATSISERELTSRIIPTNGNIYMRGVNGGSISTYRNIVWNNNGANNFQNIYENGYIKSFNNVTHTNISFWYRVETGITVNITNKPYIISMVDFGISSLTVSQMDYWFNVYQALLVSDTNAIFSLFAPKQQESWITPTLLNSWVQYSTDNIGYMKDTMGFVHLKGSLYNGTVGSIMFTLPSGYRHTNPNSRYPVVSNGVFGRVTINNGGGVTLTTGSNAWVSLDGITFKAEA